MFQKPFRVGDVVYQKDDKGCVKHYVDTTSVDNGCVSYSTLGGKLLQSEGMGSAWHAQEDLVFVSDVTEEGLLDLCDAINNEEEDVGYGLGEDD